MGGRGQILDVLVIGADIADVGKGEGDDLPQIGRVGENFLVAGQRGVEADFGLRLTGGADAVTFNDGAVSKHQNGGGLCLRPWAWGHVHSVGGRERRFIAVEHPLTFCRGIAI